ncbi:High affinity cGMP-specific 3',5'-cyclic phosphodiesterase 9A [Lamellibrachia satsuma]|nr:High affinity cGMP-specific 3',5'-cyclic phosphodiesterase 9A [Lamellibrachia satsuma]
MTHNFLKLNEGKTEFIVAGSKQKRSKVNITQIRLGDTMSDVEKLEGLPVAPFMDREKVTKPSSQVGFIKFVLLPLFEALGEQFPMISEEIILPVRHALQYYSDMQNALEEEKKRQTSLESKNNVK